MNTVGKVQIVNGSDVWHADPPIIYIPIIDQILSTTIYTFKILIFALEGSQQIVGNFIFQELLNKLALQSKETKYKKLSATIWPNVTVNRGTSHFNLFRYKGSACLPRAFIIS